MAADPAPVRPLPESVDHVFEPYFRGLHEHRILVPRCGRCGTTQFPPREVCAHCQNLEFVWFEAPTTGTIYTFCIAHRPFHPWFADKVPYASVVAQVADGVCIMGACFTSEIDDVRCGADVTAAFVSEGDLTILEWRLDDRSASS